MKRKAAIIGAIFGLGLTATAASADRYTPSATYYTPYNWSGPYVGGHIGAAWSDLTWSLELPTIPATARMNQSVWGPSGGFQAGYQHQFGPLVAGVEVSYSGVNRNDQSTIAFQAVDRLFASEVRDLLLATGRLGFAQDRLLYYVKGGWAQARVDLDVVRSPDGLHQTSSSKQANGYTIGGGLEYGMGRGVSIGLEYDYIKLNSFDQLGVSIAPTILSNHRDVDPNISTVWVRINFRLDRDREAVPLK